MTADGTLAAEATQRPVSFRLKGGLFPLTLLDITHYSRQAFEEDLKNKVAEAPAFFQQTPVVLSLELFQGELPAPALSELCQLCRQYGLIPVALRGGREEIQQHALAQGLALMAESRNKMSTANKASLPPMAATEKNNSKETTAEPEQTCLALETDSGRAATNATHRNSPAGENPAASTQASQAAADIDDGERANSAIAQEQPKARGSKIVTTPVRSGQQVYAAGGDLIVMAAVSAGAEVLADGNIHVYGALRGRALAGVRGDTAARVFCHSLEAELISIAGNFKLDEDLRSGHWKQPVQIHLDDQALRIEPLLSRSLTTDN